VSGDGGELLPIDKGLFSSTHVHDAAVIGSLTDVAPIMQALALAQMLQDTEEWEIEFADVLSRFEERFDRKVLYTFVFF
jgi:hypothetical protein